MAKSRSYWEKRHGQWISNQDKMDAAASAKLAKDYARTSRELEKEISSYFQRYGKDNVIEFRVMLQDMDEEDRNLLFQDMEAFAEKYPEHAGLLPVRESIYKLNRLEGLHYSTQIKLLELGALEHAEFEKHLRKTYGKRYEQMLKELGIGNSFLSINDEVVRDTIYTKWVNDENFSDRIWKNKEKLVNHLQTRVRDGLIRGDNYAKMSKEVQDRFNVGANDARRLIWTESSFVYNQSHVHAYVSAGSERYRLSALIDSRTSDICREFDKRAQKGETFRFDEIIVGVNFPPFHTWCRTTFIGELDD
ncbi:minor capsid protein [Oceanobacillus neutriphilus]|uniref:Phage head morphogenesis domain-containing protein n=1 Tax=Oceanobacillus neutriphilus TaxID=531815 RepID=A0ABQ2NQI8_9BACI|nr:minor capsid protein [Oceanobacillus neutriphilus]GGP07297.1 hypothetical protein GCM10011346_02720 [Oceanobacillus neutriphilus]